MTRRLPSPADRHCTDAGVSVHAEATTMTPTSNSARTVCKGASDFQLGVWIAFLLVTLLFIFVASYIWFTEMGTPLADETSRNSVGRCEPPSRFRPARIEVTPLSLYPITRKHLQISITPGENFSANRRER